MVFAPQSHNIGNLVQGTTRNCMIGEQNDYIAISGCRSSVGPRVSFFVLGVVENPRFALGIVTLSDTVPDM